MNHAEPSTDLEWQDAVDIAECLIAFDAARQYGLITGGPSADLDRCVDILTRGRARGIVPRPDAVEEGAKAFAGGERSVVDRSPKRRRLFGKFVSVR